MNHSMSLLMSLVIEGKTYANSIPVCYVDIPFMSYSTVPNLFIIIAVGYWDNSRLMGLPWHDTGIVLVYTLHHPLCK